MKMNLNQKAEQAIQKLLKLTRSGDMKWEPVEEYHDRHPVTSGRDSIVDVVYVGQYGGSHFRAYEVRYQICPDGEDLVWTGDPRIELIDKHGRLKWRIPGGGELWDLLQTIQVKAEKVEDELDSFLDEDVPF